MFGYGIAVDSTGSAYVTGFASSVDFPTTVGAAGTTYAGGDAFVTKLSGVGNALGVLRLGRWLRLRYRIRNRRRCLWQCRARRADCIRRFPHYVECISVCRRWGNAFVTKLNSSGTAFTYSTYLGGSGNDSAYALATDASERFTLPARRTRTISLQLRARWIRPARGATTSSYRSSIRDSVDRPRYVTPPISVDQDRMKLDTVSPWTRRTRST